MTISLNRMIYCLRLEKNKYFVGYEPLNLFDHFLGKYIWTKIYKPTFIILCNSSENIHDITLKLMKEHGIDNVRSYHLSEVNISYNLSKLLFRNMLKTKSSPICIKCKEKLCSIKSNRCMICYYCGEHGHRKYNCLYLQYKNNKISNDILNPLIIG
jgi:hypothetical protein